MNTIWWIIYDGLIDFPCLEDNRRQNDDYIRFVSDDVVHGARSFKIKRKGLGVS